MQTAALSLFTGLCLAGAACDTTPAESLSATGLDDPEVWQLEPQFASWSDGAVKRRWLYLPAGSLIDTDDMDNWVFPVGTKAWKEFVRDGVKVETRLLEKVAAGEWTMASYAWNAAQTDAVLAPAAGVRDALGTAHDIPSTDACASCHVGVSDVLIGVSALQLDHGGTGLTLPTLDGNAMLTTSPGGSFPLPGDELSQQALGYLHANCGNCHNDRNADNPLRLSLKTGQLGSVAETPAYVTSVGVTTNTEPLDGSDATLVIDPGVPEDSLLYVRMTRRGDGGMPWLGSELVDEAGSELVGDWIRGL